MGVECPKCKIKNTSDSQFCKSCATPLPSSKEIPVTETLETPAEELTKGTTLASRYEIIEELGKGGMGRVYKVHDTEIKEKVALKLLKPEIAADEKIIERFRNELKIARKVSHKRVCRMYDIGKEEEKYFITMEYVEGKDLKSLIREKGTIPENEVLKLTKQICEGLAEAHELGIVHRDLKPQNIMIDKEGNAKIMDFGIARSVEVPGVTQTGIIIGTPDYISPEQAEGVEADQRSDIYALGIILYEMMTGRVPFKGYTALSVAIKHKSQLPKEPKKLNPEVSKDLNRLILICMEKDRERRYQKAEDLLSDIRNIEEDFPLGSKIRPRRMTFMETLIQKKLFMPALAFVTIIVVIIITVFLIRKLPLGRPILPTQKQLTFTGKAIYSTISPDGNFIAYVNQETLDEQAIIVQDIVSEHSIEVFRMQSCMDMRWMPDSSEICVSGQGLDSKFGIFIIPRLGGTSRKTPDFFHLFTLSPDGTQLAGTLDGKKIGITDKATGDMKSIPLGGDFISFTDIDWSPLGHLILFLTYDNEKQTIWTINIDGSNQQKVIEKRENLPSARWSPEGDTIFYLRGGGIEKELWSIRVSPDTGKPLKSPSLVLPALQTGDFFSITNDGKKLVYTQALVYANLWLTTLGASGDSSAIKTKQLTTGTFLNLLPSISPDGRQVVFQRGFDKSNIYVMPIEGGSPTQITFMNSWNTSPVWSPDGKEIAFISNNGDTITVWKINAKGGKPHQFARSEPGFLATWSPGSNILYQTPGNRNIKILNPETGEETPLVQDDSVGLIFYPKCSPDGKRVAVQWNRRDRTGLWLISLDGSSTVFIKKGQFHPIGWSADGKWVYSYATEGRTIRIFMIETESGQESTVMTIPLTFELGEPGFLCMSPGGNHFVIRIAKSNTDVWLIENFNSKTK